MKYCALCLRYFDDELSICPEDGYTLLHAPENMPIVGEIVDNRYKILTKIDSGGTSSVYLAYDSIGKSEVALKIFKLKFYEDRFLINRFFNEGKILSKLVHPFFIRVYNYGISVDGYLFLAMEPVPYRTLREVLAKKKKLTLKEALKIIFQIIAGVNHLHSNGIIHLDLKPENIFVLENSIKIFDLGNATFEGEQKKDDYVFATLEYTSPEHIMSDNISPQSDIYSIGIILYEMLTGKVPFKETKPIPVYREKKRISNQGIKIECNDSEFDIVVELEKVINDAIKFEVYKRIKTLREFYERLKKIVDAYSIDTVSVTLDMDLKKNLQPEQKFNTKARRISLEYNEMELSNLTIVDFKLKNFSSNSSPRDKHKNFFENLIAEFETSGGLLIHDSGDTIRFVFGISYFDSDTVYSITRHFLYFLHKRGIKTSVCILNEDIFFNRDQLELIGDIVKNSYFAITSRLHRLLSPYSIAFNKKAFVLFSAEETEFENYEFSTLNLKTRGKPGGEKFFVAEPLHETYVQTAFVFDN